MRVGLISDTHIPEAAKALPSKVVDVFRGVDLILHAGDIYERAVLDDLAQIAPVLAALGDDDSSDLLRDKRVKMKHVLKLEGYIVWLVHEKPLMHKLTPQQAREIPHVIVHGHSHVANVQHNEGTLFVGSGSPTFLNYQHGLGTLAILDITSRGVEAFIVEL